ncbi:unnamed protein product [Durusdinium trenchii]|uniref:Uncharacterized protein n=1 Tax=Durusdinium trenchii TaxID=1381693 RepID=A0ABP0KNB7_9DINO
MAGHMLGFARVRRLLPLSRMTWRNIAVVAEQTPNPDSVMFYPTERDVLGEGIQTMRFSNKCRNKCWSSPVCITLDTLDVGWNTPSEV